MKAIRYFRPDVLFAITPWHLERDGRAACGYTPPEGWRAEVAPQAVTCEGCKEVQEQPPE